MRITAYVLASSMLAASPALAAGFLLNDHGARATGRADAVTATVDDGSAIFYNPAGIGKAKGLNIYLGTSLIAPNAKYEATNGEQTKTTSGTSVVPNIYVSGAITDVVHAGVGFFAPFGTRMAWPETSPGRAIIREQTLRTFFIAPVLGLDLDPWVAGLHLGGGVDLVPATAELAQDVVFGDTVGTAKLGGNDFGFGGRVGVSYRPDALKALSVGVAWRSQVTLHFKGEGDFDIVEPYRAQLPPDGDIGLDINLPQSVLGGVAYRVLPELEIEIDVNWIDWSVYKQLSVDLPGGGQLLAPKNWKDTVVLRLGLEYSLLSLGLDLRAGYAYDPTPIPRSTLDFSLPDINRHVVSAGGSYQLPAGLFVDVGLLYVLPGDRKTADEPYAPPHKGTYSISALVGALSLGIKLGGADQAEVPALPVTDTVPVDSASETEQGVRQ